MLWRIEADSLDATVFSDASGAWGCGAHSLSQWSYWEWNPQLKTAVKEMIPVVIAAANLWNLREGTNAPRAGC